MKPVKPWTPEQEPEQMLDGTDVDAQINKKRAHKNIMAEAFSAERKHRIKFGAKKAGSKDRNRARANDKGAGGSEPPDSAVDGLGGEDGANGYIIDNGNIITIDQPHLEALNKFAYDVIKVQVTDHFDQFNGYMDGEEEPDYGKFKGNLISALQKN